jgi:hypothetical protein
MQPAIKPTFGGYALMTADAGASRLDALSAFLVGAH